MQLNKKAVVYVPDGTEVNAAVARTTHLAIAAHEDDIEFMAYAPISECFGKKDKWFSGVVVTDGAGSPRSGIYADCSDEDMKAIRIEEQKKAAHVGGYSVQFLLSHPSKAVKDKADGEHVTEELAGILRAARPRFVYMHNLADKHETHVATALKALAALRSLPEEERPEKLFGCEVWRDLDWMSDEEKVFLDTGAYPHLARALSGVFDSQISGGKRYELAAEGRRLANATFSASHACDTYEGLNYAMDLTPLLRDVSLDPAEFVAERIRRFETEVRSMLHKFY